MARPKAKIVSLMDISDSMESWNYLTPAKSDLNTFINMFQPGDKFAIISFSTEIYRTYPTTANLVPTNPETLTEASAAVNALTSKDLTNIGDAIKTATALLQGEPEPRAEVLLSDGLWNRGPDPLSVLPKDIRVDTIALGDNGQIQTLQEIARLTDGTYLFTPDSIGLASLYFEILDYADVGRLVYNGLKKDLTNTRTFSAPVRLAGGLESASIGVNWADPSITYASGTPSQNQVTVQILDPDFRPWDGTPDYQEDGFVVFTIPEPKAGTWIFNTTYYGPKSCNVTTGALDPDQLTTLALEAPTEAVPAGRPFTVRARVTHDGQPVEGCSVSARADQPSVSVERALEIHRAELDGIELPQDRPEDDVAADRMRLSTLRQQRLPAVDVLPRHVSPGRVRETGAGELEIEIGTLVPGEYVVQVEAVGPHPRGGELMRTKRVCVSVR